MVDVFTFRVFKAIAKLGARVRRSTGAVPGDAGPAESRAAREDRDSASEFRAATRRLGTKTPPALAPDRPETPGESRAPGSTDEAAFAGEKPEGSLPAGPGLGAERDKREAAKPPDLTTEEEEAFRAIGLTLSTRTEEDGRGRDPGAPVFEAERDLEDPSSESIGSEIRAILDLVPAGLAVFRRAVPIYANRALLDLLGCADLAAAWAHGGLGPVARALEGGMDGARTIDLPCDGKPVSLCVTTHRITWNLEPATLVGFRSPEDAGPHDGASPASGTGGGSRDMAEWKKIEEDLRDARLQAERASALKSDFLAKVSHEIRTPLNAILGFAEVIMDERFGPIGNARYKDYLKDIHASGALVMSLVNDLLDLSKIEAGKMDLAFAPVDANGIVAECASIMQPQASRERVVLRLSLDPGLPSVYADERSLRQIVLNLLSNAIKFNEPGGQVVIATALGETGQAVLRIKDTGIGMSDAEIEIALEPFRQVPRSRPSPGTGLGLPLTKALVEANRAQFSITSKKSEGTLVEIAFPPA